MARVLAAVSLGGSGHLDPMRPWLDAARRGGHEVLVVGPPAMRPLVEAVGHEFAAGGEPPESAIAPIRDQLPLASPEEAAVLGNLELFGRLAASAMLEPVGALVDAWTPDVVLRDPCEYASAVAAAERGLPAAQVAISLASVEAGSILVAAPALEEHRAGLADALFATPYLTRFPAALDPSPFTTTVRVHDPLGSATPLPAWWPADDERPLVYVTFGTVMGHMALAADVYRVALAAVADLPVRVLLTVGRAFDPSLLGVVPANVHVETWVDQADVLASAALVVCHGGSGTVFGALAAGVPVVVVPVFADQFENGRLVTEAGAGCSVEASGEASDGGRAVVAMEDVPRVADAIRAALGSRGYRDRAREIADEMAATPTVDEALAELLRA